MAKITSSIFLAIATLLILPSWALVLDHPPCTSVTHAAIPTSTPSPAPAPYREEELPLLDPRQEGVPNPEWPPSNNTNSDNNDDNNNDDGGDNSQGTGSGSFPHSGNCTDEGLWVCNGDEFQRCASGLWSEVMAMAEGTACSPNGETENMSVNYASSAAAATGTLSSNALAAAETSSRTPDSAASIQTSGKSVIVLVGTWVLMAPMVLGWA